MSSPLCRPAGLVACLAVAGFMVVHVTAAEREGGQLLKGKAAFGDWTEDAPGVRRLIRPEDLPPPSADSSVTNHPKLVSRPKDAWPKAPRGFRVELLTDDVDDPRNIIPAPNGDLFVAESKPGRIKVLRVGEDGQLAQSSTFVDALKQPFGIAFYPPGKEPTHVYVGNTGSVVRFPYRSGDMKARGKAEMIAPDIPGGGHLEGGGHWTRDVIFTPDGRKMFVSVGSESNNDDAPKEKLRADILEFNPDGSGMRVYAWGIRNPVGLAIEPETGRLWASVNERDKLGDDLVPDYITHIQEGSFYGWPWYYIGDNYDPKHVGKRTELAEKVIVPDVLVQAHSASLCMTFYTGKQFPSEYRGDAFAAQHGSWNRARRTGYKVIRVPIKNGKAGGEYVDFLTGFVTPDGDVWGRPVGVTVGKDGSLFVSDDGGECIWRVSYATSEGAAAR